MPVWTDLFDPELPDEHGPVWTSPDVWVFTADLPPVAPPAPTAPGWRALATLLLLQVRAGVAYLTADGWRSRRALAALAVLLVVVAGLAALVVAGGGDGGGPGHFEGPGGFVGGHSR